MFVNILSANDKYSLLKRNNLRQTVQPQLSKKQKTYSQFVSAFLKGRLNVEHFQ